MILWSRRALMWAASLWLAAVVATNAFYFDLFDRLGALAWFVCALPLIVAGAALAVMAMVQTTSESSRILGLCVLVLLVGMWWLTGYTHFSMELGVMSRLFRCERAYMRQVDELTRGSPAKDLGSCGAVPRADPGPPMRVAFPWSGWGENRYGVIYDASTETAQEQTDALRHWVAESYTGYTHDVAHLRGPWYFYRFRQAAGSRPARAPAGLD